METFSALLAICAGNSPVPDEIPAQRPVTRSFDVFFDLRPNEQLNKQWWGWWFETPSWSLWRHSNEPRGLNWDLHCRPQEIAICRQIFHGAKGLWKSLYLRGGDVHRRLKWSISDPQSPQRECLSLYEGCATPPNTWRNDNVVIAPKRRHFDVITSKWRRFAVITTSLLRNVSAVKRQNMQEWKIWVWPGYWTS